MTIMTWRGGGYAFFAESAFYKVYILWRRLATSRFGLGFQARELRLLYILW
jgi:hypothetical protein